MPKVVLTDRSLKALKPAPSGKNVIVWDAAVPGFGVRVSDKGTRTFVVVKRPAGSANVLFHKLGRYPELSLAQARQQAPAILGILAQGKTPEQAEREREQAAAERLTHRFAAVAEEFIAGHLPRLRSKRAAEALIRNKLIPAWGDRPVTSIGRRDVIQLAKQVAWDRGPYAARHTLAQVSKLFNWALANDLGGLEVNPCGQLKTADLLGAAVVRDRVLSDDEVGIVWRAAEATPYPFGPLIKVLLLTGQRRDEIGSARWAEIDPDKALLTIAPERMKKNVGHTIPLTQTTLALLRALPRYGGAGFVFSTTGGERPFSGFSKAKRRFDSVAALAAPWTLHDIRRTVRTGLSSVGVLPFIAELVVGHMQQGVAKVYDLHRYDAEKRDALDRWERHLLAIVGAKSSAARCVTL